MKKLLTVLLIIAIVAVGIFAFTRFCFSRKYISHDEALNIAVTDAGVDPAKIRDISIDFEKNNGVASYEVEFDVGLTEYEYLIDPVTGIIADKRVKDD